MFTTDAVILDMALCSPHIELSALRFCPYCLPGQLGWVILVAIYTTLKKNLITPFDISLCLTTLDSDGFSQGVFHL